MKKLIVKYLSEPSRANARKLVNYQKKHPFAQILGLTLVEQGLLKLAAEQVAEGR